MNENTQIENTIDSQYYVGTGELNRMFTLRHQYEELVTYTTLDGGTKTIVVLRDIYLQNLSTDKAKAVQAAELLGYEVEEPLFTLEQIERLNNSRCEEARLASEYRDRVTQQEKLDGELARVKELRFPFGRDTGFTLDFLINEKGEGWAGYWMKQGREEDATATITALGAVLETNYPEIARVTFFSDKGNGKYYVGEGRQKDVKVTCVACYGFDGVYGYTYIEKFVTETGELLMYMGSACLSTKKGDALVIDFGIKTREEYEGEHQTRIQRVKIK